MAGGIPWTKEEDEYILQNYASAESTTQFHRDFVCAGFNRTYQSVTRRASFLNAGNIGDKKAYISNAREKKQNEYSAFFDLIKMEALESVPREPKMVNELAKQIICLNLSDVHYGATCNDIYGNVIYNSAITETMMKSLCDQLCDMAEVQCAESINIFVTGDIITGEHIYKGQSYQIDLNIRDQIAGAGRIIFNMLKSLDKYMKLPIKMYWVPGNHGRITKEYDVDSNFDLILADLLTVYCNLSKIDCTMYIASSSAGLWELAGWRVMQRHKGVSQDSTPARTTLLGAWNTMHNYDIGVTSHFHRYGILDYHGKKIIRNAAMKPAGAGQEEERGYGGQTGQAWWVMNEDDPMPYGGLFKL